MFDRFKDALIPGTKVDTADIPARGGVVLPNAPLRGDPARAGCLLRLPQAVPARRSTGR